MHVARSLIVIAGDRGIRFGGHRLMVLAMLGLTAAGWCDSVVVFNEVAYHPAAQSGHPEWLELHNQMTVDVDLSDWSLAGGIDYHFPDGTIIPGGGHVVVAADPAAMMAHRGYPDALGPFTGKLDNAGDTIRLLDPSRRVMDELAYEDEGAWPVGADGTGATLAKLRPGLATAPPEHWAPSAMIGGTPGSINFTSPPAVGLRFNEVPGGPGGAPWVELINAGTQGLDTKGYVIERLGAGAGKCVLGAATLAPSQILAVPQATLQFTAAEGDRLILIDPTLRQVRDAVAVQDRARVRKPDGSGPWLTATQETPGAANQVALHQEIVINEIMYHRRGTAEVVGQTATATLLASGATARAMVPDNNELGLSWTGGQEPFDDAGWNHAVGTTTGVGYDHAEDYQPFIHMNVDSRMYGKRSSVYIRIPFTIADPSQIETLRLRMMYDDGFVAYLNGTMIAGINAPVGALPNELAPTAHEAGGFENFDVTAFKGSLVAGANILAIHGFNASLSSSDALFLPELEAVTRLSPSSPYIDSAEEWIELYNRGATAMDLGGWMLSDGVNYAFAPGTMLGAGEYLVVAGGGSGALARDMREAYPGRHILGPFEGQLSNRGERIVLLDAAGNPADEVTYYDEGQWPESADGRGSSLELRDPDADNSRPEAWAASDESAASPWQTITYRGVAADDTCIEKWNEFIFGFLDAGECLIDDVRVVEDPDGEARQLIQNGTFDGGLGASKWRAIGNHRHGGVIADPDNAANKVYRLVANGVVGDWHDHMHPDQGRQGPGGRRAQPAPDHDQGRRRLDAGQCELDERRPHGLHADL